MGRLQSSTDNRNWDSIEELWKIKECGQARAAVRSPRRSSPAPPGAEVIKALRGHRRGPGVPGQGDRRLPGRVRLQVHVGARVLVPHLARGPGPGGRGGHAATSRPTTTSPTRSPRWPRTSRPPRPSAWTACRGRRDRERLQQALDLSLRMNPLTPDHHFYIDQGTNARVRLVLIAIGRKLVEEGKLNDPEDVMYLQVQRAAGPDGRLERLRRRGPGRRPPRRAGERLRDPARATGSGTATEEALAFPYLVAVGVPGEGLPQAARPPRARSMAWAPPSVSSRAPPGSFSPRSSSLRSSGARSWSAG